MIEEEEDRFYTENKDRIDKISEHYRAIIELLGEDAQRDGLLKTPYRAAKAIVESTVGYRQDASKIVKSALFDYAGSNMVIVKDIEFYSLCEHHILPFFGKVSIGYIPDGYMVGLSKLARVVNVYAKRLQVQERLTHDICELLRDTLSAKGVIVLCEAGHLCMKMRGVEKQESTTVTVDYTGDFEDSKLREEFLKLISER